MVSALDVAQYLLSLQDEDAGDTISNLKLQKLLYYSQGYYLAMYGVPLFSEKIRKWQHGPVVREVYQRYKEYGSQAIPAPEDPDFGRLDDDQKEFVREIYKVFGQFSAWKLRNMTHNEAPWQDASMDGVISHHSMREYFADYVSQ